MIELKGYCIIHANLNLFCLKKIWNNKGDFSKDGAPFVWNDLSQAKKSLIRAIDLNAKYIKNQELAEFFLGLVIAESNLRLEKIAYSPIFYLDKISKKD